jgi:hypothetical protein
LFYVIDSKFCSFLEEWLLPVRWQLVNIARSRGTDTSFEVFPLIAAAAGTTAAAAYLNAKYHITHDASLILGGIATQKYLARCEAEKRITNFHVLRDQALKNCPDRVFIMFEGRTYTYGGFFKLVTRLGNWLMKELDIKEGEIVALDGENSPEYLVFWWALEGIGAVPSFLNNNLTGNSLVHCVKVCHLFVITRHELAEYRLSVH